MQVVNAEMKIPLKYKFGLRTIFMMGCVYLLFSWYTFQQQVASDSRLVATAKRFPALLKQVRWEMMVHLWVLGGILLFFLCCYGLLFLFLMRKCQSSPPYLRVNHEGIFFSFDSFLLQWAEIRDLSLISLMGSPVLGITWDAESVSERVKGSRGRWLRLRLSLSQRLARSTSFPLAYIYQWVLPLTLSELLAAIQEQFATELNEHHITLQGWRR